MKRIVTLCTMLLAILTLRVNAQADIAVNEILQYMSKGEQTGFEFEIPEANSKTVTAAWKKLMKKYKGKTISSKKSPEIFTDNALIKDVSENTVDVYARIIDSKNGTTVLAFVDLGGTFVSSDEHSAQFTALENVFRKFGLSQAKKVVELQLEAEEKQLKELEKDFSSLVKEKEGYIKNIEDAKALILQREQDIVNNEENQTTKQEQIEIQKEIINTVQEKLSEF